MVKNLLIPFAFVIFAQMLPAQIPVQGCQYDTVAAIYVIRAGGQQTVRCITAYDIIEVQRILVGFFNNILYPQITFDADKPKSFKVKKT